MSSRRSQTRRTPPNSGSAPVLGGHLAPNAPHWYPERIGAGIGAGVLDENFMSTTPGTNEWTCSVAVTKDSTKATVNQIHCEPGSSDFAKGVRVQNNLALSTTDAELDEKDVLAEEAKAKRERADNAAKRALDIARSDKVISGAAFSHGDFIGILINNRHVYGMWDSSTKRFEHNKGTGDTPFVIEMKGSIVRGMTPVDMDDTLLTLQYPTNVDAVAFKEGDEFTPWNFTEIKWQQTKSDFDNAEKAYHTAVANYLKTLQTKSRNSDEDQDKANAAFTLTLNRIMSHANPADCATALTGELMSTSVFEAHIDEIKKSITEKSTANFEWYARFMAAMNDSGRNIFLGTGGGEFQERVTTNATNFGSTADGLKEWYKAVVRLEDPQAAAKKFVELEQVMSIDVNNRPDFVAKECVWETGTDSLPKDMTKRVWVLKFVKACHSDKHPFVEVTAPSGYGYVKSVLEFGHTLDPVAFPDPNVTSDTITNMKLELMIGDDGVLLFWHADASDPYIRTILNTSGRTTKLQYDNFDEITTKNCLYLGVNVKTTARLRTWTSLDGIKEVIAATQSLFDIELAPEIDQ